MAAAVAAAAAAASTSANVSYNSSNSHRRSNQALNHRWVPFYQQSAQPILSRYETQKRNDWNTFRQYLMNHRPNLSLCRCSGVDVLDFLDDQFGNTKIHTQNCPFLGNADSPCSCSCPVKEAWSSLDGLVGRLRVAFGENGGQPEMNPFSARVVRVYLSQVRDAQAKSRG